MSKVVRGDLSFSVEFNRPVREVIWDKLPLTIIVAGTTILFTWTMAISLGIYAAVRHRTFEDYSLTFIGFIGLAIPDFLLALAFLWIGWFYFDFSIGGLFTREYIVAPWTMGKVVDMFAHLWIPVIALGTAGTASLLRIMLANLLDELRKPYVVTARAKGPQGMASHHQVSCPGRLEPPEYCGLSPALSCLGQHNRFSGLELAHSWACSASEPVHSISLFGFEHNPVVGRNDGSRNALVRYSPGHS